jgi:hypothetical protein
MELSPFVLYLILQLDTIRTGLDMALFALITATFMFTMATSIQAEKFKSEFIIKFLPYILICGLGAMLLPSTKSALTIWAVPTVLANEQVQALPDNLVKALNTYLTDLAE